MATIPRQTAADTCLKLLDRVVSGATVLTGGVFEFVIVHHRYVQVLCMLYKTSLCIRPSVWCSTCAVCASAGYKRCCGCTSVYLWASSLQNLAVPQNLYSEEHLFRLQCVYSGATVHLQFGCSAATVQLQYSYSGGYSAATVQLQCSYSTVPVVATM